MLVCLVVCGCLVACVFCLFVCLLMRLTACVNASLFGGSSVCLSAALIGYLLVWCVFGGLPVCV